MNKKLIYDALNNSPEFSRYIIRSLSEIIARTIVQVKMYYKEIREEDPKEPAHTNHEDSYRG